MSGELTAEMIIVTLQAEIAKLTAERDELNEGLHRARATANAVTEDVCIDIERIKEDRDQALARLKVAESALEFYADPMNYSVDYDTSQNGVSRRVILYSDQEERNECSSIAGKRAREALKQIRGKSENS